MLKTIYSLIRNQLSTQTKKTLTGLLFSLGLKPTINKKNTAALNKGVVVFSADFEMAWAFRYSKSKKDATKMGLLERKNFPEILNLFNRHHIPVTWATVGHLFLKKCKKSTERAHPEMRRPGYFENKNWSFQIGDWYDMDPCSDYRKDPAWYAPDLIEMITKSSIDHEIACHSFSHIDFTDQNCTTELADSELEACSRLAAENNIRLKSMVFPGGTVGNLKSLVKYGFTAYRRPMKYDIDLPYKDEFGLISIPSSYGLDGNLNYYSSEKYIAMGKSFIDAAVKYNLICHFWFHPSMHSWYLENVLPELLEYVSELKILNKIDVMTMQDIAEMMLKND